MGFRQDDEGNLGEVPHRVACRQRLDPLVQFLQVFGQDLLQAGVERREQAPARQQPDLLLGDLAGFRHAPSLAGGAIQGPDGRQAVVREFRHGPGLRADLGLIGKLLERPRRNPVHLAPMIIQA